MNQNLNDLTEAALAEWQYAHREELDSEQGELVEFDFARQVSVTMSFRLSGAEADSIREAAREAGMTLSEWIRQAAADAIRPGDPSDSRPDVDDELIKAEGELDALRKRLAALRQKRRPTAKTAATK